MPHKRRTPRLGEMQSTDRAFVERGVNSNIAIPAAFSLLHSPWHARYTNVAPRTSPAPEDDAANCLGGATNWRHFRLKKCATTRTDLCNTMHLRARPALVRPMLMSLS